MSTRTRTQRCYFLELPTELRLEIYDYCLTDTNSITVTSAAVTDHSSEKNNNAPRTDIPGLPPDHIPLIRYHYDPSLLSISSPPTIINKGSDLRSSPRSFCARLPYPTPLALLQTNHQIHDELSHLMRMRRGNPANGGMALYISYPYGVLVLKALYPSLPRQARNVYISGYYNLKQRPVPHESHESSSGSRRTNPNVHPRTRPRLRMGSPPTMSQKLLPYPEATAETAHVALGTLVRSILSPAPAPLLRKLEIRVFYPGESTYSSVWADEESPIVEILSNVCGGKIDIEVFRGRRGNGVALVAYPNPRGRIISTVWRRLGNSKEESEGFVIGEHWPEA
ncbi:hypothetical protein K469DRAFT_581596 [Zopfia rhizophila CBS 207.26]|uniref:F-box domain-containing protein n=1 Tax=Zopfia rhizophila CBS 207.26 TaxID=1314779 RepID=A0A6A6DZS4_9PEZI|nr:hypothetical protein K469DRAFT_581596 [Zopfia rhizophila CBS 207.26]